MILSRLKANNFLLVYLVVIGIINIILLNLPLTNVFGYEFSAVNAIILTLLSALFNISFFKSNVKENKKFNLENYLSALRWMLFLPFAISVLYSMVVGFCSFTDGLFFYFVITFPSLIIGSALGSAIFVLLKKFRIIFFIILFLLILFVSVLEIYFNPQIYLYNPIFAYWPGTIYDEGLGVDLKLCLYRLFNLMFFLPILFYFVKWGSGRISFRRHVGFLSFVIGIAIIFYFFLSPIFGFTTAHSKLQNELSSRVESNHFMIYADHTIDKKILQQIVLHQEFFYERLCSYFKEEPAGKITSFIFITSAQKKELFGSGAADVAKPWLNSVYVSLDTWESTLKHEIAHCFTASFGTGIFKLAAGFNPALIEGVAEAADGFYDENSIHYMASLAYKNDYQINLNSVFNGFSFFSSVSSLSYIYSGSFISFLVNEFGIEKVKQFYKTNEFQSAFDTDLPKVVKMYEAFLRTLEIDVFHDRAKYYFGRKPLFSKVCPRYTASNLNEAWELYGKKKNNDAAKKYKDILSKADSYSALVGLSKIYEGQDSLSNAIKLLQSYSKIFSNTSSEYDLKLRLADLLVKRTDLDSAAKRYEFISDRKPSRRYQLLADTRLALLESGKIESYMNGSDFDKYTILKKLNSDSYVYPSIPLMIDLSYSMDEDYKNFLSAFKNDLKVNDELSCYAVFKLSEYMLKNYDFLNARKMAGLALRYKENPNIHNLVQEHHLKTEWFYKSADRIMKETKFVMPD
jgi:hypothetical protein